MAHLHRILHKYLCRIELYEQNWRKLAGTLGVRQKIIFNIFQKVLDFFARTLYIMRAFKLKVFSTPGIPRFT